MAKPKPTTVNLEIVTPALLVEAQEIKVSCGKTVAYVSQWNGRSEGDWRVAKVERRAINLLTGVIDGQPDHAGQEDAVAWASQYVVAEETRRLMQNQLGEKLAALKEAPGEHVD